MLNLTAPVRVAVIDVAGPLADLDCSRAEQPPYTAAWILVCRDGRPLGSVEIPLRDPVITVAELEREVRRQLGDDGGQDRPVAHQPPPLPLSRASVVVPTNFARPAELRRCLKTLAELDHPDYEVIVVDNRPADAPPADLEGVRVVREPRPGISAARNRGVSVATGEIIAFTDDDVQVQPGWLSAIGGRFARQPHVSVVTGLVVPLELETQAQIFFEQSGSGQDRGYAPLTFERAGRFRVRRRDQRAATDEVRSLYLTGEFGFGANMAFRTAVLQASGGFDEALGVGTATRGGEDLAMFVELLTAGHQIGYEPAAIIEHQHRATMADLDRQIYGYGLGFTAMLTAVALRDPWHLLGLAAIVPAWLRSLRAESSAKSVNRADDYPPALARAELRGMAAGPVAYLRARRASPPWRR
ncbi:MAG TPA: glycosyltransferase [Trebonia sp.]|nr:glycosyltransferase [Trebonia sp.]